MARNKADQANIDASDLGNYPDKRIRNNDGSGNGTPVNESVYGDIHEYHAKIMRDAKESYNGLPDNVSNGYQLYDAAMSLGGKNDMIKNIVKLNDSTLSVPLKIAALKNEESVTFKADFASTNLINFIQGNDGVNKLLTIAGSWVAGQFVRIINYNNLIQIVGLYDSQIVPSLPQTITDIQTSFAIWSKIMAVFTGGGAMVFFNRPANEIPPGWQEVVDWRGRFPVGLDLTQDEFNVLPKTGGSKKVTLTSGQLPKTEGFFETISYNSSNFSGPFSKYTTSTAFIQGNAADFSHVATKFTFGNNEAHENLPPYRTVLFIEFIG